ncbi:hypothetical protein BGX28_002685 [Mortierella sp. GBA30]|nr:hypothetical protein BGX28_002685 [Mortierella sp. GBA30]
MGTNENHGPSRGKLASSLSPTHNAAVGGFAPSGRNHQAQNGADHASQERDQAGDQARDQDDGSEEEEDDDGIKRNGNVNNEDSDEEENVDELMDEADTEDAGTSGPQTHHNSGSPGNIGHHLSPSGQRQQHHHPQQQAHASRSLPSLLPRPESSKGPSDTGLGYIIDTRGNVEKEGADEQRQTSSLTWVPQQGGPSKPRFFQDNPASTDMSTALSNMGSSAGSSSETLGL